MRPLAVMIGTEIFTPHGMRIGGDRPSETRVVATTTACRPRQVQHDGYRAESAHERLGKATSEL
jgi:hypothetical protein